MGFPKNYNRNMAINLKGDAETDNYKLIASGILSRTNSISESKSSYQYMDNRGTADTDVTRAGGKRGVHRPSQDRRRGAGLHSRRCSL